MDRLSVSCSAVWNSQDVYNWYLGKDERRWGRVKQRKSHPNELYSSCRKNQDKLKSLKAVRNKRLLLHTGEQLYRKKWLVFLKKGESQWNNICKVQKTPTKQNNTVN